MSRYLSETPIVDTNIRYVTFSYIDISYSLCHESPSSLSKMKKNCLTQILLKLFDKILLNRPLVKWWPS